MLNGFLSMPGISDRSKKPAHLCTPTKGVYPVWSRDIFRFPLSKGRDNRIGSRKVAC